VERRSHRSGLRRVVVALLVLLCASSLLLDAAVSARQAEPPDTLEPGASCATSECHATVAQARPHWDEMAQECRSCHVQRGSQHAFSVAPTPRLCAECHEDLIEHIESSENIHDPAEEDCLDCHDPHASRSGALLLASNVAELCEECHDDVVGEIQESEHPHDPAEEDCTDCHDPHAGPYERMLHAEGRELCGECHDDVVEIAEDSEVDHGAVLEGDECLHCHSPHAGRAEPNLKEPVTELCLSCHGEPVESDGGKLASIGHLDDPNAVWHEAVENETCAGCHLPHGSDHPRLLSQNFPSRLYAPFAVESYELCFSCHEPELVTEERSLTATGFRDGDLNLHFVHVNKKKRGRTCRMCHDVHAARGELLIRERTRYGKWEMPIRFEKEATGGSCHPGCHLNRGYDRDKR
jgi:predicted CXXCH cytochrome family protein